MVTSEIFKVSAHLMVLNLGVIYFAVIFAANVATTVVFLVGPLYYVLSLDTKYYKVAPVCSSHLSKVKRYQNSYNTLGQPEGDHCEL